MTRIQLDMLEEQVKELDELMKETNITTRKDLFNHALTLFQWAVKAKRAGRIVASLDEETGAAKEILMPALENVRTNTVSTKASWSFSSRESITKRLGFRASAPVFLKRWSSVRSIGERTIIMVMSTARNPIPPRHEAQRR